jgi:hypothetical protein
MPNRRCNSQVAVCFGKRRPFIVALLSAIAGCCSGAADAESAKAVRVNKNDRTQMARD